MSKIEFTGQTPLPMFDAKKQRMLRGSVNSASTNVPSTGQYDAIKTVFELMMSLIGERALPELSIVEELDVDVLAQQANRLFAALDELADPSSSATEISVRAQALKQLRASKPTRTLRDAQNVVRLAIDERIRQIRRSLEQAVGTSPHRCQQVVESSRIALEALRFPEPNSEPLRQLENIIKGLQAMCERRGAIPKSALDQVVPQLTQKALDCFSVARQAWAAELVAEELRKVVRDLMAYLDELAKFSGRFTRQLDAVRQGIERLRQHGLHQQDYSSASVVVELPGPNENAIIAGIIERCRVSDRRALASHFLAKFEAALREAAATESQEMADHALFADWFVRIPATRIAEIFERMFDESLGEGHSLYELTEKFGLDKLVQELTERSEPLCHLCERDLPEFNVTPLDHTVVRLPLPIGPRDKQIRSVLEETIRIQHGKGHCTILDAAPGERDSITMTKVKVGWPLAIEAGNVSMLLHYARCATIGHVPHLIGVMPDSPDGRPITSYVELAKKLNSTH